MLRKSSLICVFALAISAGPAFAADFSVGALKIHDPWSRATPKGAPVGGGYLTITNTGTTPDRLIGGSTAVSKGFEIHEMTMDKGVMKMRMMPNGLEIKPGETVTLKPASVHVMFLGLNRPLEAGKAVTATLQFDKAGKVEVEFPIAAIGAPAPGAAAGGGTMMQGGGMMQMKPQH